jgi:hypothetical protein
MQKRRFSIDTLVVWMFSITSSPDLPDEVDGTEDDPAAHLDERCGDEVHEGLHHRQVPRAHGQGEYHHARQSGALNDAAIIEGRPLFHFSTRVFSVTGPS